MHNDSPTPRRVRVAEGVYTENGSWIALYRWQGRQHSKVLRDVTSLSAAKKARRTLLADLEAKRVVPASKLTVALLADEWLASREGRVKPRTLETDNRYVEYVVMFFANTRVQDVEPRHVEQYLTALRSGRVGASGRPLAERTVGNALKTLRAILRMAVLEGNLPFNPCDRLQPHLKPRQVNRRQPTLLSPDDVDALVQAALEKSPSYAGLIATAAYTGARIREVLGLRWLDVDHDLGLIHLRGQLSIDGFSIVPPKTQESIRISVLVPKLEPFLGRTARMRARWSADDDFVFAASHQTAKNYANVRRALTIASKHAGLERVRAHDLRHSFTSNLIPHTDLVTVSRAVGHKNIGVTAQVYAHALGTPEQQAKRAAQAAAAAGLGY